jgi:hypothetical protein
MTDKHPANIVEAIYVLADLMLDASRVLEGTYAHRGLWRDLPEERCDEPENLLKSFDFLMTSKAVREYADAWQAQLDTEEAV